MGETQRSPTPGGQRALPRLASNPAHHRKEASLSSYPLIKQNCKQRACLFCHPVLTKNSINYKIIRKKEKSRAFPLSQTPAQALEEASSGPCLSTTAHPGAPGSGRTHGRSGPAPVPVRRRAGGEPRTGGAPGLATTRGEHRTTELP